MIPKLAVLGLLNRKEMHGYEIIKLINQEMTNFCNIKIGSVYFALSDLAKKGFVESKGLIKGKKEPDKTIYAITEKGKEEYIKLLRKSLLKTYAGRYPIDIVLHFRNDLQETDYKRMLADKIAITEKVVRTLTGLKEQETSPTIGMILEHQILHQTAELEWLKKIINDENI